MVSVPTRVSVVGLAATEYRTLPLPLPEPPDVTVSHGTLLVADHRHPAPSKPRDRRISAGRAERDRGRRQVDRAGDAGLGDRDGSPEIVSVPVRDALPVLAATL